jgi:hypothetical protein
MDTKNLKEVKINFNKGTWNPTTHSILLEYDSKSPIGFKMKLVNVYDECAITDVELAKTFLSKFTKK